MDVKKEKKRKRCSLGRQRHSKAAYGQKNWKVQQKRKKKKGTSGECSKS